MINRNAVRVSVEGQTIAEDGLDHRELLHDEYARHEEGADGAVSGALVGAAVGGIIAGPVGAAVGVLVGAGAGEAVGSADQSRAKRDRDDTANDFNS